MLSRAGDVVRIKEDTAHTGAIGVVEGEFGWVDLARSSAGFGWALFYWVRFYGLDGRERVLPISSFALERVS